MKTSTLVVAGLLALTSLSSARAGVTTTFHSSGPSIRVTSLYVHTPSIRVQYIRPVTVRYVWRSAGVQTLKTYKTSARALQTLQNPGRVSAARQVQVAASGSCVSRAALPSSFRKVFGSALIYRSHCPTGTVRLSVQLAPKSAVRVWRAENVTPRVYTLRLYRVLSDGRVQATRQIRSTTVLERTPVLSTVAFKLG